MKKVYESRVGGLEERDKTKNYNSRIRLWTTLNEVP